MSVGRALDVANKIIMGLAQAGRPDIFFLILLKVEGTICFLYDDWHGIENVSSTFLITYKYKGSGEVSV